jgi:CHAD domain-containing protein
MQKHRVPPAYFARSHKKLAEQVNKTVRAFLGQPNEENTHALRGAIRRLEACTSVLPKDARKGESLKEYRFRCARVFKVTSKIRNLDILESKLASKGKEGAVVVRKRIRQERKRLTGRSMKAAWKLLELRTPRLDEEGLAGSGANVRRVLKDLDSVIGRELRIVVNDETRVGTLHSLRKHCRRFRYILELMPKGSFKLQTLEHLQKWQDTLGAIRDSDIMIKYLEGSKHLEAMTPLLTAERVSRHRQYQAFVKSNAETQGGNHFSLLSLAGMS